MKQDSYQEKVGQAVADAVESYLESAGAEYAGRTGTQSTGSTLNASNGPSCAVEGWNFGKSSSSSSSTESSPAVPVVQ